MYPVFDRTLPARLPPCVQHVSRETHTQETWRWCCGLLHHLANVPIPMHTFVDVVCLQVERTYNAIVLKVPAGPRGIVETKIGRSSKDRKRMMALPVHASRSQRSPSNNATTALLSCLVS